MDLVRSLLSPELGYAATLFVLLYLTKPVALAIRKRRSGFGTIFDSVSEIPVALASVTLLDLHHRVIRTTVSDRHGRYRLLVPKGDFLIEVKKEGFQYPSRYLNDSHHSFVYDNVLTAQHIVVNDHGVMTKNIPVDPDEGKRRRRLLPRIPALSKEVQYTLAGITPFAALFAAYVMMSVIGWILFAIYILVLGLRLFRFKPAGPPFGTIADRETKQPLNQAIVRIFDAKTNKVLETQITSPKGRYAFLVKAGAYYLLVKHEGYKTVRLQFPHIKHDGFLLVKDVFMKKLTEIEVDY